MSIGIGPSLISQCATLLSCFKQEDGETVGFFSPKKTPHLVNLNEDATLSECLLYYIKEGLTRIGSPEANVPQDVQLIGSHVLNEHCIFENSDGEVKLIPKPGAVCFVNGRKIDSPTILRTGSRVILGKNHVFRSVLIPHIPFEPDPV